MTTEPIKPESRDGIFAQRIRFVADVAPGAGRLRSFAHPCRRHAVAEDLSPEELLAAAHPALAPTDSLGLLYLPAGAAVPLEFRERAEQWMRTGGPEDGPPTVDLLMRSERVLWRPGQALLIGGWQGVQEIVPGLIEFAFYEGQLRELEQEAEAHWLTAEGDVGLTHSVGNAELWRREHVDQMTRRSTLWRMRLARLQPCLEKPSIALPGPARRLAGELAMQAEITDRLNWMDDRLEVFEDLYELANDRLTEYAYFRGEYRLEEWIILLLVAEVIAMALEIWKLNSGR